MNGCLLLLFYLISIAIIQSNIEKRLSNENNYVKTKETTDQTFIIKIHDINTENPPVLLEIFKNITNPRRAEKCV